MTKGSDVVIVGGGVIGCSIARELAARGVDVTLIERGRPGGGASGAAAGMLTPQAEATAPGPFLDLLLKSRDMYSSWVAAIETETGIDVGYRRTGLLRCAFPPASRSLDGFLWQRDAGLPLERVDRSAIAARTGGRVASEIKDGLFFPEEALVDNRHLTRALWAASERRGVTIRLGVRAERFLLERGVCRGVQTSEGEIPADAVIDAAGAWSAFDAELPFPVPIEPVRGELVELRLDGAPLQTIVESDDVYLVPHADGSLVAGATAERAGFDASVKASAVAELIQAAVRVLPAAATARFIGARAGLRPASSDGLPVLGPSPITGLHFATGHFRNGILLAPVTAWLLADLITSGTSRDLTPFSVERFLKRSALESSRR